jgi:hypothetical protein
MAPEFVPRKVIATSFVGISKNGSSKPPVLWNDDFVAQLPCLAVRWELFPNFPGELNEAYARAALISKIEGPMI